MRYGIVLFFLIALSFKTGPSCRPDLSMDVDQTNSSEHHRPRSINFYLLVILCTYIFLKWLKYFRVPHNFPPGPPSVPFLGSVPFIKVRAFL